MKVNDHDHLGIVIFGGMILAAIVFAVVMGAMHIADSQEYVRCVEHHQPKECK